MNGPVTVPVKVAVPLRLLALSLVGTFHSTVLVEALKVASPREGFRSVTLRTCGGKGMVRERRSRVGLAVEVVLLVLALVKLEKGGRPDVERPAASGPLAGFGGGGARPGKLGFRVRRASKSVFFEPRLVRRSTVAGRKIFSEERLGGESQSSGEGSRSVS